MRFVQEFIRASGCSCKLFYCASLSQIYLGLLCTCTAFGCFAWVARVDARLCWLVSVCCYCREPFCLRWLVLISRVLQEGG